ncbi:uncharacterized protein [Diadema setosum]|uniref:uncharacterized protein n=1 Tax=Diadema setosum TaxID=31175 RepID=UPI003B3B7986
MSSKLKGGLTEKVEEIKRMQANWMRERSLQIDDEESSPKEVDIAPSVARPSRDKGTKTSSAAKKQDMLSWTVGGNATKKKVTPSTNRTAKTQQSLRTRSASPVRSGTNSSKSAPSGPHRKGNSHPLSARSNASEGSRPPSGRNVSQGERSKVKDHHVNSKKSMKNEYRSEHKTHHSMQNDSHVSSLHNTELSSRKKQSLENTFHRVSSEPDLTASQRSDALLEQETNNPWEGNISGRHNGEFEIDRHDVSQSGNGRIQTDQLENSRTETDQSGERHRQVSTMDPDAFDRLADQIASRVKAEMREERRDVMNRVGYTSKSILLDDDDDEHAGSGEKIEAHHCSKCKQLMIAPDHSPTLLIPCGHTFCEACAEDRIKCPTCRTRVTSTTLNATLQDIISATSSSQRGGPHPRVTPPRAASNHNGPPPESDNRTQTLPSNHWVAADQRTREYTPAKYADGRPTGEHVQSRTQGDVEHQSKGGAGGARTEGGGDAGRLGERGRGGAARRRITPEEEARRLEDEYQSLGIRCEALESEEADVLQRVEEQNTEIAQHKQQMSNIVQKQQQLRDEIKSLEERLAGLETHRQEYRRQVEDAEDRKREELDQLAMVRTMLRDMQRNRERVRDSPPSASPAPLALHTFPLSPSILGPSQVFLHFTYSFQPTMQL